MFRTAVAALLLASAAHAQSVVIDRVTVIDGTGAAPVPDAVVLMEQGRIRAVGTRATVRVPPGAQRIDGGGGYLVPGFVEMHAHVALGPVEMDRSGSAPAMKMLADPGGSRRSLGLLLANGITTARDPGGPAEVLVAVRDSVANGHLVGPRLFVAGDVIDKTPFPGLSRMVKTADDVRTEVRRQAALGVDMVKLYAWLTPDLVRAGVDEAHRMGIPAIAHVMFTTWTDAARSGLDGIVHVLGWSPQLLPAKSRARYGQMMASGSPFMYGWLELVDLDSPEMNEAINAIAQRRMHLDPTLVVFERAIRGDDPATTGGPHLAMASPALLANWRDWFSFSAGWTKDDFARARAAWPRALQLTKKLYDRGVLLTAGTDANNPWTVPGESYHRELELLAEAGIPALDVIRIATRNGAEALGLLSETGTIEPGKRADLVLLSRNPAESISATRTIQWVMQRGIRHDPAIVLQRAGITKD